MRGAPQSGLARLISRINWRTSRHSLCLPAPLRDFQRHPVSLRDSLRSSTERGFRYTHLTYLVARQNAVRRIRDSNSLPLIPLGKPA